MINTPFVQRYQTYPLQMDALECVKTSPPLPRCLLDIVEKVIRVVLIPFALIIDFFVNLVRSIANMCISLTNWVAGPHPNAPPIPVRLGERGALEIVATPIVEESEPLRQNEVAAMPAPLLETPPIALPLEGHIAAESPSAQLMQEVTHLTTSISPSGTSASNLPSVASADIPRPLQVPPPNKGVPTSSSQSSTVSATTTQAITTTRKAAMAPPPAARTLAALPCTVKQAGQIHTLLATLATKKKLEILWNEKKNLSDLGVAIRDVHPLKFLSIACSTPEGIGHIQTIFSDVFKRGSFMSYSSSTTPSFTCKLDAEAKKDNLESYLEELAEGTKTDFSVIQKDVKDKKWDNLVKHLARIPVT